MQDKRRSIESNEEVFDLGIVYVDRRSGVVIIQRYYDTLWEPIFQIDHVE